MKRTLSIFSIAAIMIALTTLMVACSSKPKAIAPADMTLAASDTAGLADFQAWKAINERKDYAEYMAATQATTATPAVRRTSTASRPAASTRATQPVAQPVAKKKGWSKAAKGAAIGGAGGAIAGAVINKKNRVLGAVIGGVIGGGVGYGIGRGQDKKDGRY